MHYFIFIIVTYAYYITIYYVLVPADKGETVFLSLQLLREDWTLDQSSSFAPIGLRKNLRAKTPAAKTPAAGLTFAERIKLRKYTPIPGFDGEILDEESADEEDDEQRHDDNEKKKKGGRMCSASSSSCAPTVTAFDGTVIKEEQTENELQKTTLLDEESAVVPARQQSSAATASPPAAKKAKRVGQQ